MSGKTPVSTLNELYIGKGITPYYDLVVNGVGTHNPIFKYRLECGDLVTLGTGKSKKEAKQDAAFKALNILKDQGVLKESEEIFKKIEETSKATVESPYHDVVKDNVVGQLILLCVTNRISEPVYELIGEEGPPHCKTFTIQCCVLHLKEEAQARTKKQAKHKSAKQMIEKLQEYFNNSLDFAPLVEEIKANRPPYESEEKLKRDQEEMDEIIKKYASALKNKPSIEHFGIKVAEYHTMNLEAGINTHLLHPNFQCLKSVNIEEIDDPYLYTTSLLEGLNIGFTWDSMPTIKSTDHMKSLSVETFPPWCFMGFGQTEEQAIKECSIELLKHAQMLLK